MTSGVIQLVSSLNQTSSDFLIGNPQITFFKSLYKQYSNFYITTVEQTINGDPNFNKTINFTLDKSGDLIKEIYLEINYLILINRFIIYGYIIILDAY